MAEEEQKPTEECKQEKCECPAGAPAWMVTYSDLVTLLLTFFVLLLSMANMDPVKFLEVSSSVKDAFGMHAVPSRTDFNIPLITSPPRTPFSPIQQMQTVQVYERVKAQLEKLELGRDVELIKKDNDTIILRMKDSILFGPGQAKITPRSYPVIRNISNIVRPLPIDMRIEGHTDNTPYSGELLNNWDLSMARAASVMRFLNQSDLLPLDRMSAVGYGDSRPITPNSNEENKARNRRVDFLLKLKNVSQKDNGARAPGNIPL
jgi:chemotaxis protein MotB